MDAPLKAKHALSKALECLEDARLLLSHERAASAVNRAYYAMFHAAEAALMAQKGIEFSSHAAVLGAFGKHFVVSGQVSRHFHQLLHRAFDARDRADYDYMAIITTTEAEARLKAAEEFIAGIRPLIDGAS